MERKLTQKELAAQVSGGLDYTYIGKIEREEQLPSLKILIKLSAALAVPLGAFFSEDEGQPASLLRTGKLVNLAAVRETSTLLKELNQLDRADVPLLVEIVRALNRHRRSEKRKEYPLVAEEAPGYDKDE